MRSGARVASPTVRQIIIDTRFNGPPDSGNGGYVCGLIANAVDGPANCTLRKPPPLGRELTLQTSEQGKAVLRDGDTVIGEAISEPLTLALPEPPSFDEAVQASAHYVGFQGAHLPHVLRLRARAASRRWDATVPRNGPGALDRRDAVDAGRLDAS